MASERCTCGIADMSPKEWFGVPTPKGNPHASTCPFGEHVDIYWIDVAAGLYRLTTRGLHPSEAGDSVPHRMFTQPHTDADCHFTDSDTAPIRTRPADLTLGGALSHSPASDAQPTEASDAIGPETSP